MKPSLKIIVTLTALFGIVNCQYTLTQQSAALKAEQTLTSQLLNSFYSVNVRPSSQVTVQVSFQIKQIIGLDEKNQILTLSCFIEQYWYVNYS